MRTGSGESFHLSYCTNVHPGISWSEMEANLRQYIPPLKARFAPDQPFGIGLRVAGQASKDLLHANALDRFRALLDGLGAYVYTLNGFPYGDFHRSAVKDAVHAPDWRDDERAAYTDRLITILAALLPEGLDGGISTSPLTYRHWVDSTDTILWQGMVDRMVEVAARIATVKRTTGKTIHLDIEPEPDGLLGDCADLIRFYEDWLLPVGTPALAQRLSVDEDAARVALLDAIRVCFDTCHVAVGYESPATVLAEFDRIGIRIGKVQVSSALRVNLEDDPGAREKIANALRPFDEPVYLHQVVQRNRDGSLTRYVDLGDALPQINDPEAQEWRVHFHVPVHERDYAAFSSTQQTISETLRLVRERPGTNHLEIETYTWDVLPAADRSGLAESIANEYAWVIDELS